MNERTNERMDQWKNEWMNEQTNEWMWWNNFQDAWSLKVKTFAIFTFFFFTIPHAICSICIRRVDQNGPTLFESLSNTEWQLKWSKLHENPTSNYGVMPGYVSRAITIL